MIDIGVNLTNKRFHKDLADVIGWHKYSEETDVEAGAILIDATKPIQDVVDQILKHIDG